jgi:ADP-heptose:LPS heptosyltransferase
MLLSSVLAEALHHCYPGCHITFWPNPRFASLLEHHPFIDAYLSLDPAASLPTKVQALRGKNFDTVLVPWSASAHAWLTTLAGIPTRVGQGGRLTYSFLFTHSVRVRSVYGDTTSHWTDIQLDYARAIGCQAPADLLPVVITTPQEKEKAAVFLHNAGFSEARPICGLHICKGLAVDEARWPIDRFVDIAANLMRRGYDVALTGTASEKTLTAKVAMLAQSNASQSVIVDLAGTCSLRETAAVIERMKVFICPDTGTGHLAAALGVPVVSIFPLRSDVPARWRPAIAASRIIRPTRYECGGPCVKETCPRFTCLLHIDADEVVQAAAEIAKLP